MKKYLIPLLAAAMLLTSVIGMGVTVSAEKSGETVQSILQTMEEAREQLIQEINGEMTQTEMNLHAARTRELMENTMNELLEQLTEGMNETDREAFQEEQNAWNVRKDMAVELEGRQAEGGSLQPLMEDVMAADLTHARIYVLAETYAQLGGEAFDLSDEMQEVLEKEDPDLDHVFERFAGEYIFNPCEYEVIVISKAEDAGQLEEKLPDHAEWVLWYTNGETLTDLDVLLYTPNSIIFGKNDAFYRLSSLLSGGVELEYSESPTHFTHLLSAD